MNLYRVNGNLSIDTSNVYVNGAQTDLSVCKISFAEYAKLVASEKCSENTLYVVDSQQLNAYDMKIENVAEPELPSDAATKKYVDSRLSGNDYALKSDVDGLKSEIAEMIDSKIRNAVQNLKITL